MSVGDELYWDPFDHDLHWDPHPVWRRMRETAPLYRNDRFDFWALSRFQDVLDVLTDTTTYSSANGDIIEITEGGNCIRNYVEGANEVNDSGNDDDKRAFAYSAVIAAIIGADQAQHGLKIWPGVVE